MQLARDMDLSVLDDSGRSQERPRVNSTILGACTKNYHDSLVLYSVLVPHVHDSWSSQAMQVSQPKDS